MTDAQPQIPYSHRFRFGIRLALLLLGLGMGVLLVLMKASPWTSRPVRILLVAPPPDPDAGLSHYQARALALLVEDALEASPEYSVTVASAMPERLGTIHMAGPWLLIQVAPRRRQDRLGVGLQWIWDHRAPLGDAGWERAEIPFGTALEAFRGTLRALPLALPQGPLKPLLPTSDGTFWQLVQAGTLRLQNAELDEATRLARAVTEKEPGCAEGWFLLGSLLYRSLLDAPGQGQPTRLAEAESCFNRGLSLLPLQPRGVFQLAQLKTNEGDHRNALELLLTALGEQPRNPLLLAGVVYSARNAGLLDLARKAAERRDRWTFWEVQPLTIDLLDLYLGDLPRFEATLKEQPGHLRSGVQRFFKGYLALIRKQREAAVEAFRSAESVPRGYPHYLRLARGYRLATEGSMAQAAEAFRALELDRVGLQVPDGEFTLRLAEGYALCGESDHALEMAERAFAQGFGAAAWYERSPFLAPLRMTPRWRALMQHVQERQRLLENRFPLRRLPGD